MIGLDAPVIGTWSPIANSRGLIAVGSTTAGHMISADSSQVPSLTICSLDASRKDESFSMIS